MTTPTTARGSLVAAFSNGRAEGGHMPGAHTCPNCSSTTIHRSRSWMADGLPWGRRLAATLGFCKRPYRCTECRTRFWDQPESPPRRHRVARTGVANHDTPREGLLEDRREGTSS